MAFFVVRHHFFTVLYLMDFYQMYMDTGTASPEAWPANEGGIDRVR